MDWQELLEFLEEAGDTLEGSADETDSIIGSQSRKQLAKQARSLTAKLREWLASTKQK